MKLRVVLVEPREAGNVGAAARVMKNFGILDLAIVGAHPSLHPIAGWWGSGADDVIATIRFMTTLQEAVADCRLTIATTSSRGRTTPADFTPRTLSEHARSFGADDTIGLVFGREDSGLTREELALCQRSAVIPTDREFPTMNLAQSVGVFCYELSLIEPVAVARTRAQAATLERAHERMQALLMEVGFLQSQSPDRIYEEIRTIVGRADLDDREVTIALGIIRQIEWKLRAGGE